MSYENLPRVHTLIGGMTTDYFDFWCEKCGEHIDRLSFHAKDIVGVQLEAKCKNCNETTVFKIKVSPSLVPFSRS